MNHTAAQLLEEARQLPAAEFEWLLRSLLGDDPAVSEDERLAVWQKEVGEPEPGYDEWFRAGVEEALADTSGDVSHAQVTEEIGAILRGAHAGDKLKASA